MKDNEEQNPSSVATESPRPAPDRSAAVATFQIATQCSDHRDERIAESDLGDALYYGDNGEDEFASAAVFRAANGDGFIVAVESSDYTGHGCQCSGSAERFSSLDDALRLGLSDDDAELCGATEERNAALQRFDSVNTLERDAETVQDGAESSLRHEPNQVLATPATTEDKHDG